METIGTVISLSKQWWLKVNKKAIRFGAMDGAVFPHVAKIQYSVNGKNYVKRQWLHAGNYVPAIGTSVTVIYDESKPSKSKIKEI